MVKHNVEIDDLPPSVRKEIEKEADLIPVRYDVYARVFLTLRELPLADAKWVVNKIRREFDALTLSRKKNGSKPEEQ